MLQGLLIHGQPEKSWGCRVFSIHMSVLLWSGSFALSAGNPTVGPAACAAPGEEKSSSRAGETRGTFQLEHPLIAGALKVTDGGADHRKDTMTRPAMSKSRLPLVIKAGFCFVLEHARDAQGRSRSQAGVARILMLDRKPCRAAAHWSRRLRAQLLAGLAGPAGSLLTPCRCLHQQPRVIDSDEPFSAALSRQGGTVLPRKGRGRQVWGCSQGLMYKFWDGAAVQTPLCCLRCKSR